jgi:hypothetical protein
LSSNRLHSHALPRRYLQTQYHHQTHLITTLPCSAFFPPHQLCPLASYIPSTECVHAASSVAFVVVTCRHKTYTYAIPVSMHSSITLLEHKGKSGTTSDGQFASRALIDSVPRHTLKRGRLFLHGLCADGAETGVGVRRLAGWWTRGTLRKHGRKV